MTDNEFGDLINESEKDAKQLYDEFYASGSLYIPSGFSCYWTGFIHGMTMIKTKLEEKNEANKK